MRNDSRCTSNTPLHRLILMVATEPDATRRQARVAEDVELLRAAIGLYVGMRQPQGRTTERVGKACQVYDVAPDEFMDSLRAMVAAPGSDDLSSSARLPLQQKLYRKATDPVSKSSDPSPQESNRQNQLPPSRYLRKKVFGYGSLVMLILFLAVVVKVGGSLNASAVLADSTIQAEGHPVIRVPVPPPRTAVRPTGKGKHWIKLARTTQGFAPISHNPLTAKPAPTAVGLAQCR